MREYMSFFNIRLYNQVMLYQDLKCIL